MLAADIHHQLVVDEHPHIVVAQEFKVLARHVFEGGLDLHGKAVVVRPIVRGNIVVHGVRHGTGRIEELEVVQEEKTSFRAFRIFLAEPESVVGQGKFKVTTGGVGVAIAGGIGCDNFGQEPVAEVFCNFAVAREVCSRNRNAVGAQFSFDHALHNLVTIVVLASTGTEILACGAGLGLGVFFVAAIAMQPVEHHDRELLDGAVAEFAGEFRIEFGFAVLGTHNPDGIGNLQQGIQLDFLFHGDFFLGGAFGTDMQVTDGLLERNKGVFGGQYGAVFEPAAVGTTHRSGIVGLAVQHDDHTRIAPRSEEADRLLGRFHNDRFGR